MIMKRPLKIIKPGDKGFDPNVKYPWTGLGEIAGIPQNNVRLEINGFFIRDTRFNPAIAIFRNCQFVFEAGNKLREEPVPFQYAGEAYSHIKSMHLSSDDEPKLRITALVPDPGMGVPRPNVLFVSKDELKNR